MQTAMIMGRSYANRDGRLIASVPPAQRGAVGLALRSSFADALNELLYVTAGLAFVGAVCAMVLIRKKDFHPQGGGAPEPSGRAPTQETV